MSGGLLSSQRIFNDIQRCKQLFLEFPSYTKAQASPVPSHEYNLLKFTHSIICDLYRCHNDLPADLDSNGALLRGGASWRPAQIRGSLWMKTVFHALSIYLLTLEPTEIRYPGAHQASLYVDTDVEGVGA